MLPFRSEPRAQGFLKRLDMRNWRDIVLPIKLNDGATHLAVAGERTLDGRFGVT
jgi:hypothetical protein